MAITKLWAVKNKMDHVADYDINPLKSAYNETVTPSSIQVADIRSEVHETGLLIDGINCDPKFAVEEFTEVKKKYGKEDGVLAYHGFVSFPNADGLDPIDVLSIAKEMVKEVWGEHFQVLLSVHMNTGTLHCHFLVNSVSFVDGHKATDNEKNYYHFKAVADKISRKYNLTVPVPHSRKPLNFKELQDKLIRIRMESPDLDTLKEKLEAENIKYCGKKFIRVKDGRYVKLSQIDTSFATLFEFADQNNTKGKPNKSSANKPEMPFDIERGIGRF